MKLFRRYPTVRVGMQTPDERFIRVEDWRPCGVCGEMTNWVNPRLPMPVCSDECDYQAATGRTAPGS